MSLELSVHSTCSCRLDGVCTPCRCRAGLCSPRVALHWGRVSRCCYLQLPSNTASELRTHVPVGTTQYFEASLCSCCCLQAKATEWQPFGFEV